MCSWKEGTTQAPLLLCVPDQLKEPSLALHLHQAFWYHPRQLVTRLEKAFLLRGRIGMEVADERGKSYCQVPVPKPHNSCHTAVCVAATGFGYVTMTGLMLSR